MKRLIHDYFELSYAQYLALPRTVLQSMPEDWQEKFVELLDELDNKYDWLRDGCWVKFKDSHGRWMPDELGDYERGRRQLTPQEVKQITDRHNILYELHESKAMKNKKAKV